jgi:hypothetical protein
MQKHKLTYNTIFLIISAVATLFVLTEIVMKFFGKSICNTEACNMTAQSARFGDMSIFLLGFGTFVSLAGLGFLNQRIRQSGLDRLVNIILIVALACEGFFMGYLAFRIHTPCLFCITIFVFMVSLGVFRLLAGNTEVLAGFGALAAVFVIQYLVLPAGVPVNLPLSEQLILFYSKDCKHCTEVIKELDDKKIHVAHLPVSEYAAFLKDMGIENIPTLMVNSPYQKIFLTGKEAISRYLIACTNPSAPSVTTPGKKHARARGKDTDQEKSMIQDKTMTPELFSQPALLTSPDQSAADNGMCKEEQVCK